MMTPQHLAAILAPLLLMGCVQDSGSGTQNTMPPQTPSDIERERQSRELLGPCDAGPAQEWIGRQYSAAAQARLLEVTGARTLRPVRPGEMVTMDFVSDRLTLDLGENDRIIAIRCG